jgi:hypothetical protein
MFRCPSAVAPPWLPMVGTINGWSANDFNSSTTARLMRSTLAMPRLPAVTATVCPGFALSCKPRLRIASWTAAGMSPSVGPSSRCFSRNMRGSVIPTSCRGSQNAPPSS